MPLSFRTSMYYKKCSNKNKIIANKLVNWTRRCSGALTGKALGAPVTKNVGDKK
jgi:hypothetical protein